jgi:hypothetical protein
MTPFAQALFFLSSYCPLFAVFALLGTFGSGVPTIICVCLAALGALLLPMLLLVNRHTAPQTLNIERASPRDADVLAYIASYLVPFASGGAHTARERAAILIFIVLIGVLYVRTEMFYINPLLALAGYRVYAVETPGGTPVALLGRRRFVPSHSVINAVRISDYVWREQR